MACEEDVDNCENGGNMEEEMISDERGEMTSHRLLICDLRQS